MYAPRYFFFTSYIICKNLFSLYQVKQLCIVYKTKGTVLLHSVAALNSWCIFYTCMCFGWEAFFKHLECILFKCFLNIIASTSLNDFRNVMTHVTSNLSFTTDFVFLNFTYNLHVYLLYHTAFVLYGKSRYFHFLFYKIKWPNGLSIVVCNILNTIF